MTLKIGALCWNQYTDWPALQEAGQRADRLGYDSLWTWDHLYPIVGDSNGPILEGWMTLAAEYDVDELVVVTITHDPKARLRSYELLAEAFGLPGGLP